jgi:hypothetical protein
MNKALGFNPSSAKHNKYMPNESVALMMPSLPYMQSQASQLFTPSFQRQRTLGSVCKLRSQHLPSDRARALMNSSSDTDLKRTRTPFKIMTIQQVFLGFLWIGKWRCHLKSPLLGRGGWTDLLGSRNVFIGLFLEWILPPLLMLSEFLICGDFRFSPGHMLTPTHSS